MQNRRAYSVLDVKAVNDELRTIEGVASTPTPDRYNDVVDPMGAIFETPMPLLLYHSDRMPVGTVDFAKATKAGIPFKASIPNVVEEGTIRERVNEAWHSLKYGLIRAVSIGFKPIKYSFMDDGGIEFQEWEWLELSLVAIPANADAVITAIKSVDGQQRAAFGRAVRLITPGASGVQQSARKGAIQLIPR